MTDPTPADIPSLVAEPDDSIGREIYPRGKPVTVTARHVEIAKLLYAARPFVMGSTPTTFGATIGKSFDWDGAPAYYQTDMLELADAVLPALLDALTPKEAELVKPPREYEVSGDAVGGGEAGQADVIEVAISEVVDRFPDWQPTPAMLGFARACLSAIRTHILTEEQQP